MNYTEAEYEQMTGKPAPPLTPTVKALQLLQSLANGEGATSEAQLVRAIVLALTSQGWTVLCAGQRDARGAGSTVGLPDLIACLPPADPTSACLVVLLEVKHGKGRVRPDQQRLANSGISHIVRSVRDALDACGITEKRGS